MVGIAQLVERWLVVPDVAGSSPVTHPTLRRSESKGSDLLCVTKRFLLRALTTVIDAR